MDDNKPGECGGQRRAYTLRCDYRALRDVKAASTAHQVGDDYRKDRAVDACADTIQQLHADQPIGIVREGVQTTPNCQDQERNQKQWLTSPFVSLCTDQHRHWHHYNLRRDDAR